MSMTENDGMQIGELDFEGIQIVEETSFADTSIKKSDSASVTISYTNQDRKSMFSGWQRFAEQIGAHRKTLCQIAGCEQHVESVVHNDCDFDFIDFRQLNGWFRFGLLSASNLCFCGGSQSQ